MAKIFKTQRAKNPFRMFGDVAPQNNRFFNPAFYELNYNPASSELRRYAPSFTTLTSKATYWKEKENTCSVENDVMKASTDGHDFASVSIKNSLQPGLLCSLDILSECCITAPTDFFQKTNANNAQLPVGLEVATSESAIVAMETQMQCDSSSTKNMDELCEIQAIELNKAIVSNAESWDAKAATCETIDNSLITSLPLHIEAPISKSDTPVNCAHASTSHSTDMIQAVETVNHTSGGECQVSHLEDNGAPSFMSYDPIGWQILTSPCEDDFQLVSRKERNHKKMSKVASIPVVAKKSHSTSQMKMIFNNKEEIHSIGHSASTRSQPIRANQGKRSGSLSPKESTAPTFCPWAQPNLTSNRHSNHGNSNGTPHQLHIPSKDSLPSTKQSSDSLSSYFNEKWTTFLHDFSELQATCPHLVDTF